MKFVLIIAACLANNGGASNSANCSQERISLPGITNETGCHLAAQMELRQWTRTHLDWQLNDAYCDAESTANLTSLPASSNTAAKP